MDKQVLEILQAQENKEKSAYQSPQTITDMIRNDFINGSEVLQAINEYNKNVVLEVYAAAEALVNHMNISVKPDFLGALNFEPIKFLISGDPAFIHKVYPSLKSQLPKHEVVTSDPFFIEVTPKGINKGNALETLADKLGIPLSETAAVGDSVNDLAMIERAGIGVAMGNASEQVKQTADFVTKTNDEDGIAFFLDQFGDPLEKL